MHSSWDCFCQRRGSMCLSHTCMASQNSEASPAAGLSRQCWKGKLIPGRGAQLLIHPSWTPVSGQVEELSPHQAGAMSETLHTASGAHVCMTEWGARLHMGMFVLRVQLSQLASPVLETWAESQSTAGAHSLTAHPPGNWPMEPFCPRRS